MGRRARQRFLGRLWPGRGGCAVLVLGTGLATAVLGTLLLAWLLAPLSRPLIDGGWTRAEQRQAPTVTALALGEDTWFAGTDEAGVYRSRDRGRTWQPFSRGLGNPEIRGLVVDADRGRLVVATEEGVEWSPLGESRFRPSALDPRDHRPRVLVQGGGVLWTVDSSLLYRSGDGGRRWSHVPLPAAVEEGSFPLLTGGEELLVAGDGALWTLASDRLEWVRRFEGPAGEEGDPVYAVTRSRRSPEHLALATSSRVAVSGDGGRSWQSAAAPDGIEQLALLGDPPDRLVALVVRSTGNGAGAATSWHTDVLLRSLPLSDAAPWRSAGTLEGVVETLEADPAAAGRLVAGGSEGVFVADLPRGLPLGKVSWKARNGGLQDTFEAGLVAVAGDRLVAVLSDGRVRHSLDGGRSFSRDVARLRPFPRDLVVHPDQPCRLLVALGVRELRESADCGFTWEARELPVEAMALLHDSGTGGAPAVYAALRNPPVLARSDDFGTTWQTVLEERVLDVAVVPPSPRGPARVLAIAVPAGGPAEGEPWSNRILIESSTDGIGWSRSLLPSNTGRVEPWRDGSGDLVASTRYGLHRYDASAGRWREIYNTPVRIHRVGFDPSRGASVYVCTGRGVEASPDGGRSWKSLGVPVACRDLLVTPRGTLVVAGSDQVFVAGRPSRLELLLDWWLRRRGNAP